MSTTKTESIKIPNTTMEKLLKVSEDKFNSLALHLS